VSSFRLSSNKDVSNAKAFFQKGFNTLVWLVVRPTFTQATSPCVSVSIVQPDRSVSLTSPCPSIERQSIPLEPSQHHSHFPAFFLRRCAPILEGRVPPLHSHFNVSDLCPRSSATPRWAGQFRPQLPLFVPPIFFPSQVAFTVWLTQRVFPSTAPERQILKFADLFLFSGSFLHFA